jgi:hypothetical protein
LVLQDVTKHLRRDSLKLRKLLVHNPRLRLVNTLLLVACENLGEF